MRQFQTLKCFVVVFGVIALPACSLAADYDRETPQASSQQQVAPLAGSELDSAAVAPDERPSWYQPPPEDQHPYVPPPKKRYIPLAGDSTGPVIILPGGNGPQPD